MGRRHRARLVELPAVPPSLPLAGPAQPMEFGALKGWLRHGQQRQQTFRGWTVYAERQPGGTEVVIIPREMFEASDLARPTFTLVNSLEGGKDGSGSDAVREVRQQAGVIDPLDDVDE